MRTTYYEELRRVHEEIRQFDKKADASVREEKCRGLTEAVERVLDLAYTARKEGLLMLEEAMEQMEDTGCNPFLKSLVILVVDGTDPEELRNIGMTRYFCSDVTDYDSLVCLLYLEGALGIQAGNNPRILEEKEIVMLPDEVYCRYRRKLAEEQQKVYVESTEGMIERLCSGKRLWNPGDNGYFVMKLADYALCDTDDRGVQRLLREVDNMDLTIAMKGLSGDARRRIFDNLSERLVHMVAEDMEAMGPVRALDVLESVQKLLTTLIRLVDCAEILGQYEYLEPFYDMFRVDAKNAHDKDLRFDKLKQLVKEYEETTRRNVQ